MTDKEKIKAKIEQLMYAFNLEADIASCEDVETEKLANIKYQVCKKILEYIDSMQEESVSDDLEKSAKNYGNKKHPMTTTGANESAYDFKAGAKWQKEQDEETLKDRIINAYNRGMEQMKKQMMAEAIDVEVKVDAGGYPYIDKTIELYDYDKDIPLAKEGDKVKIVVIKGE